MTAEQTTQVKEALEEVNEDLYWRLHTLSKILESSGVIDEHRHTDAYATILDAMHFVKVHIDGQEPVAFQERQMGLHDFSRWYECPKDVVVPKELEQELNGVVFQWRPLYTNPITIKE
jgi:hypothetical protein